jgi:hypothetical protein
MEDVQIKVTSSPSCVKCVCATFMRSMIVWFSYIVQIIVDQCG